MDKELEHLKNNFDIKVIEGSNCCKYSLNMNFTIATKYSEIREIVKYANSINSNGIIFTGLTTGLAGINYYLYSKNLEEQFNECFLAFCKEFNIDDGSTDPVGIVDSLTYHDDITDDEDHAIYYIVDNISRNGVKSLTIRSDNLDNLKVLKYIKLFYEENYVGAILEECPHGKTIDSFKQELTDILLTNSK